MYKVFTIVLGIKFSVKEKKADINKDYNYNNIYGDNWKPSRDFEQWNVIITMFQKN